MFPTNPAIKRIWAYLGITLLTFPMIFCYSILFIILIGSRLKGMSIGAMVGIGFAWLLFPYLFWRPLTSKATLVTVAILALSYACLAGADALDLHLTLGAYGLYDFILFFSFPCMLLFEVATHIWWPMRRQQSPNA